MQRSSPAPNTVKILLLVLAAAALAFFFHDVIADGISILFGACLLAFLVSPLAALLEKKLPRSPAVLLSLLLSAAALLGLLGFLAPIAARQFSALMQMLPAAFSRLHDLAEKFILRIGEVFPQLSQTLQASAGARLSGLEGGVTGLARSAAATVGGFAGGVYRLALSVILSFFLMNERERVLLRVELMLPSRWRRDGVRLGRSLLRELRLYLRGQATIALAVGALAALGLTIIGVKGGALLGMIIGLCNMIPYFGQLIGSIPAVLLALSDGWQKAALTAGVLVLVQQIDGMVISPRIMGNITGFSPAVVLLAIYLASRIGGIWGLLLSMPVLMALRTVYRVCVSSRDA